MTLTVTGSPTADELAAVLAVLRPRPADRPNPYELWRAGRLAALRRSRGSARG